MVVQKDDDGSLAAVQWSDLSIDEAEDLGATVEHSSVWGWMARQARRRVRSLAWRPALTVT